MAPFQSVCSTKNYVRNFVRKKTVYIVCIGISTYPLPQSKTPPTSFLPSPPLPLNLQTVQASSPHFRQSPFICWFFMTLLPFLKTRIFTWIPKIWKFFILHSILTFRSNEILSWNFPVWILSCDRAKHSCL